MGKIGANDPLWTEAALGHQEGRNQAAAADRSPSNQGPNQCPTSTKDDGVFIVGVTFLMSDQRYDRGDDKPHTNQRREKGRV